MAEDGTKDEKGAIETLAQSLLDRMGKDPMPVKVVAQNLAHLVARAGKVVHLILTGCNTCSILMQLKALVAEHLQPRVWVLSTNEVWSSDLSSTLWHFYAGHVSEDLDRFHRETRTLT